MQDNVTFERIELDWKRVNIENMPDHSGLYQIYGTSPLYGLDTLLYIGIAGNLKDRLSSHLKTELSFIGKQPNKTFRIAHFQGELLPVIEDILIVMHKPSFNSSRIINVSAKAKTKYLYIQNHGDRGLLNIETTNYYFVNPESIEKTDLMVEIK